MTNLDIALPDSMREYIDRKIEAEGYSNPGEYIRHLIREDQKRAAKHRLETLLLEGLASGEPVEITDKWWERKRREVVRVCLEDAIAP